MELAGRTRFELWDTARRLANWADELQKRKLSQNPCLCHTLMVSEKIHRRSFQCPATARILRQAQDERWQFFPAHGELVEPYGRGRTIRCQEDVTLLAHNRKGVA